MERQQGFRALVPPPIHRGGTGADPGPGVRRKRARVEKPKGIELDPNTTYSFVLPYPPVSGNHAVRHALGRHYRGGTANYYRNQVKALLARIGLSGGGWQPITNLRVRLKLCPPDARERDSDNVQKELADALTLAGFWVDDSNKVIKSWEIDWLPSLPQGAIHINVSRWTP